MKRKTVQALVVAAFLCAGALAGADVFDRPLTAETAPIFAQVRSSLAAHAVQKGDFTQTKHIARLNRDLASSGAYLISRDDGIVWQTKKPYPSTMTVTRRAVIQTAASGKKTVLQAGGSQAFESFAAVISSVFQGGDALNADNFDIYFEGSAERWTAGVVPKDSALRSVASRFVLQGADGVLSSVTMHESGGDSVRYDLSATSYADALTAEELALFGE